MLTLKFFGSTVLLLAGAVSALATSAVAADRPFDVWRSSDSPGHYFRHDYGSNTWVETIDCHKAYTFTLNKITGGNLRLYDASRKVFVELQNGAMWLWTNGASSWTRFRNGSFDKRYLFQHKDPNGGPMGYIGIQDGCVWKESLVGGGFTFRETSGVSSAVVLYDSSRNLYVRLDDAIMSLRQGGAGAFKFFKYGSWQ